MERLVVFGATGAVGRRAVCVALQDPRVESVTAVMRGAAKDPAFFSTGDKQVNLMKFQYNLSSMSMYFQCTILRYVVVRFGGTNDSRTGLTNTS
jgi:1-deoxy-D-xylulose 5-phosphate reductoisomerase